METSEAASNQQSSANAGPAGENDDVFSKSETSQEQQVSHTQPQMGTANPRKSAANLELPPPGAYSGTMGEGYQRLQKVRNCSQTLEASFSNHNDTSHSNQNDTTRQPDIEGGNATAKLDEEKRKFCTKAKILLGVAVLLILLAVAIVVPVVLTQNSSSEEDETLKGVSSLEEKEEKKIDFALVPNITNATIQAIIEDPFSQQGQAYEWIARDPNWDTYEDWRKQQRFAMACFALALKKVTTGYSFATHRDECEMNYGFPMCGGDVVTRLGVTSNRYVQPQFYGSVPPEVAFLSHLEGFEMEEVNLDPIGELMPISTIHTFPPIRKLRLVGCRMGGSIPSYLGLLTSLTSLELSQNDLISSIPSELGMPSNLTSLILSENSLTGSIPEEIGDLLFLTAFNSEQNPDLNPPLPPGFCSDNRTQPWELLQTDWCSGPSECCATA